MNVYIYLLVKKFFVKTIPSVRKGLRLIRGVDRDVLYRLCCHERWKNTNKIINGSDSKIYNP